MPRSAISPTRRIVRARWPHSGPGNAASTTAGNVESAAGNAASRSGRTSSGGNGAQASQNRTNATGDTSLNTIGSSSRSAAPAQSRSDNSTDSDDDSMPPLEDLPPAPAIGSGANNANANNDAGWESDDESMPSLDAPLEDHIAAAERAVIELRTMSDTLRVGASTNARGANARTSGTTNNATGVDSDDDDSMPPLEDLPPAPAIGSGTNNATGVASSASGANSGTGNSRPWQPRWGNITNNGEYNVPIFVLDCAHDVLACY